MATWVPRLDPTSGYYYYFCAANGVTTWDRPLDYVPTREDYEERWDGESVSRSLSLLAPSTLANTKHKTLCSLQR